MRIDLLCVGSVKESFFREAISEYSKRLSRYVKLNIFEVKDEKTPDNASEKEKFLIMKTEAKRLEKYIAQDAYLVALAIEGKQLSSEKFADQLSMLEVNGKSHLQFIIGGSLGMDEELKRKADFLISFSEMTFPHQLIRIILLEQIYRAYRIKNNEPYHK